MPADPEHRVAEHLGRLREDVSRVAWADAAAVRARGAQRTRHHAVAGALTTLAVLGAVGFGFFGGPFRAGTQPADFAGVPPNAPPYSTSATETSPAGTSKQPASKDAPSSGDAGSASGNEPGSGHSAPGSQTTDEDTASTSTSPKETRTETETDTPSASSSPSSPTETTTTPSDDETTPETPSSPTTSSPPLSTRSSGELLLPPGEMYAIADGSWSSDGDAEESEPVAQCQSNTLSELGASDVAVRSYHHSLETEPPITGAHVVGVFETEQAAEAAYDSLSNGLGACTWGEDPDGPAALAVDEGAAAWWFLPAQNGAEFEVTGLVRRGTALSLVTMYQPGQDYHDDPEPTVRSAWELLDPDA